MANDTNSSGIILRTIHREWCERRARWRSQQLVIITTVFRTGSRKPLGEIIIPNEVIVREASLIVVKERVNPWGSLLTTWNWRRARRLHPFMAHWWRGASPLHPCTSWRGALDGERTSSILSSSTPWRPRDRERPRSTRVSSLQWTSGDGPFPEYPLVRLWAGDGLRDGKNLTTRLVTGPRGLAGRGGRGFLVLLPNTSLHGCLPYSSPQHPTYSMSSQHRSDTWTA